MLREPLGDITAVNNNTFTANQVGWCSSVGDARVLWRRARASLIRTGATLMAPNELGERPMRCSVWRWVSTRSIDLTELTEDGGKRA